jgi:CRP/FNR family cyclic AMP-dependent transcriptional regulator
VHVRQLAATRLCADLDGAHGLEEIHRKERVRDRRPDGQQAVVAQHQVVLVPQVAHQARLLVVAQRNAFVVVVGQAGQHEDRMLRQRQHAGLLCRHGDAVDRMRVQHAGCVVPRRVNGAVNREAGRVDRERRLFQLVALQVDLDQARSRDLLEHQSIWIDEKLVLGSRHARADVGEHQVIPVEQRHQPIGCCQVHARLPLLGRVLIAARRKVENGRCHGNASCGVSTNLLADNKHSMVALLSRLGQAMNTPVLTIEERHNIESASWFSKLSQPLRNAILSRAYVRRLGDGAPMASRGTPAEEWCGVAKGAVRVSLVSLSGKQVTLTYVEPGTWFGDIALFDGLPRTHDADAHGETTLLCVRKPDFKELLAQHPELYEALLRLNCRRLRLLFNQFEDLNTKPLSARLAKQILLLAKSYGIEQGEEIRIGLQLAQEDLAQLLGASRQRVNQELKGFERDGAVRVEPTRLVVLSREKLLAISEH